MIERKRSLSSLRTNRIQWRAVGPPTEEEIDELEGEGWTAEEV